MRLTVVIPCRDEGKYIAACLDSIVASGYPTDSMEIFVVDGTSTDSTRSIVRDYSQHYPCIRLINNPKRTIPAALNLGIREAHGDVICRVDAHSICGLSYFSKCVQALNDFRADVAGGILVVVPRENTLFGQAIAFVISNPIGVGDAHYRTNLTDKPRWVDTVPFGCYRRQIFDKIGHYDERMERSEDMDLHSRLRKAGYKILLVPDATSYYKARSNFREFVRHSFINGVWVTYPLRFGRFPFAPRHLVPLIFVLALLATTICAIAFRHAAWPLPALIVVYFLSLLYPSGKMTLHKNDLRYLPVTLLCFLGLHLSYGIGSLFGLINPLRRPRRA